MTYQPQIDPFPNLRQVVEPGLAALPHPQLRARIDSRFGMGTAESIEGDLEGIFDGIAKAVSGFIPAAGQFLAKEGPGLARIGGGILQGAMAGSAAGLPGILAGAAAGGAGAGLSHYGRGTARDIGGALSGITNLAGQFTPMGRTGQSLGGALAGLGGGVGPGGASPGGAGPGGAALAALGSLFGGNTAAGQMASAMQRPELQQALAAMRLGPMGRPSIPVGSGQTPVPTGAFSQLLAQLSGQMAREYADSLPMDHEAAEVDFMRDGRNGFYGDPANSQDRAQHLWALLNAAQSERLYEAIALDEAWTDSPETPGWDSETEYYDQMDLAEAAEIEAALWSDGEDEGEAEAESYVW